MSRDTCKDLGAVSKQGGFRVVLCGEERGRGGTGGKQGSMTPKWPRCETERREGNIREVNGFKTRNAVFQ